MLVVMSSGISLMDRICFMTFCVLERSAFPRDTGEALPMGHSKLAAADAPMFSKSSFC